MRRVQRTITLPLDTLIDHVMRVSSYKSDSIIKRLHIGSGDAVTAKNLNQPIVNLKP